MLGAMVHLQHTVIVEPVPRRWFEQAVLTLYDLVAQTRADGGRLFLADGRRVPDVRLAEGGHLRAGAVYEADDDAARIRVRVLEWDRRSAVRAAQTITDGAVTAEIEGVLRDVEHPRTAGLRGSIRSSGTRWSSLTRAAGTSRLRLDDWWTAAAGTGPGTASAPLEARLDHRLGVATVRASPHRLPDGRWAIRVSLTARGRSLPRPLTAVALRLAARSLHRSFTGALESAATHWNETVPGLVARDMPRLRERALDALADPRDTP